MEQKGSFIGFTFGNRHSSKLGIFRTISNRCETSIAPPAQDTTIDLGTVDGSYYWGSKYTKRDIPISFAFYGMTEEQLTQLKQIFNDKKTHNLILDEEPYKVWTAKLTSTAVIKHLCFERDSRRFYCGEGTFVFTAFCPFARSRYQYMEDYTKENIREWLDDGADLGVEEGAIIYPAILSYDFSEEELESGIGAIITFKDWLSEQNLFVDVDSDLNNVNSLIDIFYDYEVYGNRDEWAEASRIPWRQDGYSYYSVNSYKLRNAGDVPMPFIIYFKITNGSQNFNVRCADSKILLEGVVAKGSDEYIAIDGHARIIQGCDENYNRTNNLYNEKIIDGDFFDLPLGELQLVTPVADKLEFNYLYL